MQVALCQRTTGVLQAAAQRADRVVDSCTETGRTGHAADDLAQCLAAAIEHRCNAGHDAIDRLADRGHQATADAACRTAAQATGQTTDHLTQATQARAGATSTAGRSQTADQLRRTTDDAMGDAAYRAGQAGDAGRRAGHATDHAAHAMQCRGQRAIHGCQRILRGADHLSLRQCASGVLQSTGCSHHGRLQTRSQGGRTGQSGGHGRCGMAGSVNHRLGTIDHAINQRTDTRTLQQPAGQFFHRADRRTGHRTHRVSAFLLAGQHHGAQSEQSAVDRTTALGRTQLQANTTGSASLDRTCRSRHGGQRRGRGRHHRTLGHSSVCASRGPDADPRRAHLQLGLHRDGHVYVGRGQLHRQRSASLQLRAGGRQHGGQDVLRIVLAVLGDQGLQVVQPGIGSLRWAGQCQRQQPADAGKRHGPWRQQGIRAGAFALGGRQLGADDVGVEGSVPDQAVDTIHGWGPLVGTVPGLDGPFVRDQ